jgi:hypothetical protein
MVLAAVRRFWTVRDPKNLATDALTAATLALAGDALCQIAFEKSLLPGETVPDVDPAGVTGGESSGESSGAAPAHEYDTRRTFAMCAFSLCYGGGFLHFLYRNYTPWILAAAKNLPASSALRRRLADVSGKPHALACAVVDNAHCGLLYTPAYFIGVGALQGDSFAHSKDNLLAQWPTSYASVTGFWVPFMWCVCRHALSEHAVCLVQYSSAEYAYRRVCC